MLHFRSDRPLRAIANDEIELGEWGTDQCKSANGRLSNPAIRFCKPRRLS
jgi:hypothetical protein